LAVARGEDGGALARLAEEAARAVSVRHFVEAAPQDEAAALLPRRGRCADLVIVDRPDDATSARDPLFEAAVVETGRPVLVATPERVVSRVGHLSVAWDGSRLSARALGDALAVFPEIAHVDVLVVVGDKDAPPATPAVDAAEHLARRGVAANVIEVPRFAGAVSVALDAAARAAAADVLALGGFGHSRLRELVLGGVTRDIARTGSLPLLFAH
ncbi:MAG TPA: hypothetical protein VIL72_09365, partial [Beijerinckiaceae bacterium]